MVSERNGKNRDIEREEWERDKKEEKRIDRKRDCMRHRMRETKKAKRKDREKRHWFLLHLVVVL